MFKRICKAMLKDSDEAYIEALSYCARRFEKCKFMEDAEEELEKIDGMLWNIAMNAADYENDYTGNALRITSALRIGIDEMELPYRED